MEIHRRKKASIHCLLFSCHTEVIKYRESSFSHLARCGHTELCLVLVKDSTRNCRDQKTVERAYTENFKFSSCVNFAEA